MFWQLQQSYQKPPCSSPELLSIWGESSQLIGLWGISGVDSKLCSFYDPLTNELQQRGTKQESHSDKSFSWSNAWGFLFLFVKEPDSSTTGNGCVFVSTHLLLPSNFFTLIEAVMSQVRNIHLEILQTKCKTCQQREETACRSSAFLYFMILDVFRSLVSRLDMQSFKNHSAHFKLIIPWLYISTTYTQMYEKLKNKFVFYFSSISLQ